MVFSQSVNGYVSESISTMNCPICGHNAELGFQTCRCGQKLNVELCKIGYILTLEQDVMRGFNESIIESNSL